jgi:transcription elongation factor Elf1
MEDCIDDTSKCPTCRSEKVSYLFDRETKEERLSCWKCGNLWLRKKEEYHPADSRIWSFRGPPKTYCN